MKKYFLIYFQIINFSLKQLVEYRLNAAIRLAYAPAYVLVMYLILQVVFSKANSLAGWNKEHSLMIFYVYQLMYASFLFVFLDGLRDFMWHGIREGKLDSILVKPVNAQFLVTFGRPQIDSLFLFSSMLILFLRQLFLLRSEITLPNFLLFLLTFILGWMTGYFVLSSYATTSFFVTKSQQVIEFIDKVTDYSLYPTSIFPGPIQALAFSILPFAYFSFVPTSFLFGKGNWFLLAILICVLSISIIVNQYVWKKALKHYSSASS
jgi:ABC-2 type transport system permease protein